MDLAAASPPSFHRKVEFLPEKKKFTGFRNGGEGFRLETLNRTTLEPKKHGDNGNGNKSDVAECTERAVDPELSFRFTMRRIGAGLINLGNTCFLNSVLQCLTYTEPLAAYLQSGRHTNSCHKAGFCALCAIQNHVSRALQSTGRSLAPNDLVSNLRCISRSFRNARQEDAHEYMVNLLESMHRCCLPSGVPSESPSALEKSLVHKIFGGQLRSQVKCMQCSFCSDKFDPFLDLSLEIYKADSLYKALADFVAKEYLDGGARVYQCERCKQKVKALKQLSIHKAPHVLNIHLKRFACHQPGQKIGKKVHFGPTLNLKPFVTGAYDGDLKYTLYGVLVHYGGNTHSGHYSCFVRTSIGTWYSLDDDRVSIVDKKKVLDEKAYMLFYVRDRTNFIPKKSVNVVHAKNMFINVMENRLQPDSSQVLKKTFQKGPSDKGAESLYTLPASAQVDVVVVAGASKETVIKGKSIEGTAEKPVVKSLYHVPASAEVDVAVGGASKDTVIKGKSVEETVLKPVVGSLYPVPSLVQVDVAVAGAWKETITNGKSIEEPVPEPVVGGLHPVPALAQVDVAVSGASTETVTGGKSIDETVLTSVGESSSLDKDIQLYTYNVVPIVEDREKGLSNTGDCSIQLVIGDGSGRGLDNGVSRTTNIVINGCNKERSTNDNPSELVVISSNSICLQDSVDENTKKAEKDKCNGSYSPVDSCIEVGVPVKDDCDGKKPTINNPSNEVEELSHVNIQIGVRAKVNNNGDSANVMETEPSKLSGLESATTILLPQQSLGLKSERKPKRKVSKSKITTTRLSSDLIWGAAFSIWKKKHKRVKRSTLKIDILNQEHIGPSTSEETRPLPVKVDSTKKRSKRHSDKSENVSNVNGNLVERVGDETIRNKVGQNDAALANKPPQCISSIPLARNGSVGVEGNILKEKGRDSMDSIMNILTRGLEETIVARWDENEHPSSSITERNDMEPVIGYIGDDWDEEYDKGKRKKVRTSISDSGQTNPFQVLASRKPKLRKAKLDRSRSSNQPFRI